MSCSGPKGLLLYSLLCAFLAGIGRPASPAVLITEIMYHPPGSKAREFVELHNDGDTPVPLEGWRLAGGVEYTFAAGASLPPGGYAVICGSRETVLAAYPDLPPEIVFGDFRGSLANEGEGLELRDPRGLAAQRLVYGDDLPWDFLADGFGSSLERLCNSAPEDLPENWRASPLPAGTAVPGGSPGAPSAAAACPPAPPPRPRVFFSEVMYHPVLEESLVERHEFLEIHNATAVTVSLEGWRLAGGVSFTFPSGAVLGPGEYLVVARDREALAALYEIAPERLLGDYEGELDNGGARLALVGAAGQGIDLLGYDDDPPWPAGADALGGGRSWLPPELLPLEEHRYRGRSLERASFDVPSSEIANWVASPLDGPTPGAANAGARPQPLPVVAQFLVQAAAGESVIRDGQEVLVQARFSPESPALVSLEYFVDDVEAAGEAVLTVPMSDAGTAGDLLPGDGIFAALLAGQSENSIVRFRFLADRGSGLEVVSPRVAEGDFFGWHAYFVSPLIETDTPVYHVFLKRGEWGRMWTNIQGNRVRGCEASPTWNVRVPAVFVHRGRVSDVQVRYQGSRWNRTNGPALRSWPYPRPSTGPLVALSWRIAFPRTSQHEGQSVIVLNKLTQGCPGYFAGVGYRLFEQADIPAPRTRFVRLHVNGGYYHYMMEYERPGEEMMRRYHREMAEKYPERPREDVGHLFKSAGCTCDEGPYGWGDWRLLRDYCGHAAAVRYAATYDRKTHQWESQEEFIRLVEDLHQARREGLESLRRYFEERFDIDLLLSYMAIINWSVPFDDMFQNHYAYQRLSDGRWFITPWDLDRNFGEWQGATSSIYMGEQGEASNRSGWWNYLKDAFLKAYRQEYDDRLLLLNNTVLHPDKVNALIDEVTAQANPQEAMAAPAGLACSFPQREAIFRSFAAQRHEIVNTRVAGVEVDAGPDQTVFAGQVVQFDARESVPDPAPDVTYSWSNGMTGDFPTFVFEEPGIYEIELTVTYRDIPFADSVVVEVMPLPESGFQERGGLLVMEAESHFQNERHGSEDVWWERDIVRPGYSGESYMEAKSTRRRSFISNYARLAPELRYAIRFETPGEYRVWIRAFSETTAADSCHVGLDGVQRSSREAQQFVVDPVAFQWSGESRLAGPQLLSVAEPGLHYLSVWVRESGQIVDKIILVQDQELVPEGLGPAESERVPLSGASSFIRGDADGTGRVSVADAVAVLFHLFRGASALSCEDHGDADDSGRLELSDAVVVLNFVFRRGPPPAPPFPQPGPDPTPDSFPCGEP